MGLFFLVIWFLIFAAIAVILGIVSVIVVYPFLGKYRRKRILLLTFLTPPVGIASYVGCSIIAMIIFSELLNIDLGFGDTWKAPLPNNYQLVSIDMPENGSIYKDTDYSTEVDQVQQLEVIGDLVIGLSGNKYFLLDTKVNKITYYSSIRELQKKIADTKIALISNDDYYWAVKEKPYVIGGVICLFFTLSLLFFMWKKGLSFQWNHKIADFFFS